MELTSKQRAQLRGIANTIDTIVHIGSEALAKATRSESVQVIGTKFVLYRRHYDKSKRKIELVRDKKPRQNS